MYICTYIIYVHIKHIYIYTYNINVYIHKYIEREIQTYLYTSIYMYTNLPPATCNMRFPPGRVMARFDGCMCKYP